MMDRRRIARITCTITLLSLVLAPNLAQGKDHHEKNACRTLADGMYVNPGNCYTFLHCSNGITHIKDCPADLIFNERTQTCDWKSDANPCRSSGGNRPSTTRRPNSGHVSARPQWLTLCVLGIVSYLIAVV